MPQVSEQMDKEEGTHAAGDVGERGRGGGGGGGSRFEWGALCEGVLMIRSDGVFKDSSFEQLPLSARLALGGEGGGGGHALGGGGGEGEGGVERLERLRALMREAGGTRAVEYATRVEGFECLTGVILAKVQRLKETLQMDLSAQRGWVDGGSSGSVDRYRRQGLLRVRADALTIRQVCGRMRTYASGLTPS
jgi:hypothetical protein